ncbi:hypothetical protein [Aureimonas psammosilenae]|uniref:hypothetical protein n=1 Tax=Aureimonas psammosilenae TaxID=2495496 RepID=UPI0012605143|nr:hypothetical protein [Aureimonas psammosilenae]
MKVRVFDCSSQHRIQGAIVELHDLVGYVRQQVGADTAAKLRQDLETTGRARIDGEFDWFEYERVD